MSDSYSYGSSYSSNQSFIPNYPQAGLLMDFANLASQLGQQQYQWAQQQFAKTSQVTDQAVQNYLDASNLSKGMASNMLDRYQNVFQPMEDQLVHDANTYASDARIRSEMGAAESGVAQSFDANRQNMERQLQSYGIDPSSGRYAELERANDAARAAAQAGAGQAARYNTENTGRQLRAQAIAVGQQYPGQIVNTLNAQANDLAGMENAILGNANTGANMFRVPNEYLGTAMRLGYPPLGNQGGSSSNQSSRSTRPDSSGGGSRAGSGGGSGGGGNGGYGGGPSDQTNAGYQAHPAYYQGGMGITRVPDSGGFGDMGFTNYNYDPSTGYSTDPGSAFYDYGWGNNDPFGAGDQQAFGQQDSSQSDWGWGNSDPFGGADFSQYDNSYSGDYGWGNSDPFGGGDYSSTPDYSYGGGYGDADYGGGDWSSYDFAKGGAVPDGATTGGFVSQQLSPSNGQQTDDIPANLNANEFVIPRDVALWKGQEFFQKLIDQSRKARGAAPAKPQMQPMAQGAGNGR